MKGRYIGGDRVESEPQEQLWRPSPLKPLPVGEETALGQVGRSHKITVALSGSAASLVDGPDHQALAAPHVTGGEDPRHVRSVVAILSFGVGAVVALDAQLFKNRLFRTEGTHGQEHQVGRPDFFRARQALRLNSATLVFAPGNIDGVQFLDVPVLIPDTFFRLDQVNTGVVTKTCLRLLLAVIEAVNAWPLRPGIVRRTGVRGPWQDLELYQGPTLVPQGGADTVCAGIATTNDDDVLVSSRDVIAVGVSRVQ